MDTCDYIPEVHEWLGGKSPESDSTLTQGDDVDFEGGSSGAPSPSTDRPILLSKLTVAKLPKAIRSEKNVELIKTVSRRVVRITVTKPSQKRPEGDIFKHEKSFSGSGFAVFFYGDVVIISTNKHVLFNDEEVHNSTVEFFVDTADKNDSRRVTLCAGSGLRTIHTKREDDFTLAIYMLGRHKERIRHEFETSRGFLQLAQTGDVVTEEGDTRGCVCLISHPKGLVKRVSFGEIFTDDECGKRVLRHTAASEKGSSGGPILVFSSIQLKIPLDSIWYHMGRLTRNKELKIAKLQVNDTQMFVTDFLREIPLEMSPKRFSSAQKVRLWNFVYTCQIIMEFFSWLTIVLSYMLVTTSNLSPAATTQESVGRDYSQYHSAENNLKIRWANFALKLLHHKETVADETIHEICHDLLTAFASALAAHRPCVCKSIRLLTRSEDATDPRSDSPSFLAPDQAPDDIGEDSTWPWTSDPLSGRDRGDRSSGPCLLDVILSRLEPCLRFPGVDENNDNLEYLHILLVMAVKLLQALELATSMQRKSTVSEHLMRDEGMIYSRVPRSKSTDMRALRLATDLFTECFYAAESNAAFFSNLHGQQLARGFTQGRDETREHSRRERAADETSRGRCAPGSSGGWSQAVVTLLRHQAAHTPLGQHSLHASQSQTRSPPPSSHVSPSPASTSSVGAGPPQDHGIITPQSPADQHGPGDQVQVERPSERGIVGDKSRSSPPDDSSASVGEDEVKLCGDSPSETTGSDLSRKDSGPTQKRSPTENQIDPLKGGEQRKSDCRETQTGNDQHRIVGDTENGEENAAQDGEEAGQAGISCDCGRPSSRSLWNQVSQLKARVESLCSSNAAQASGPLRPLHLSETDQFFFSRDVYPILYLTLVCREKELYYHEYAVPINVEEADDLTTEDAGREADNPPQSAGKSSSESTSPASNIRHGVQKPTFPEKKNYRYYGHTYIHPLKEQLYDFKAVPVFGARQAFFVEADGTYTPVPPPGPIPPALLREIRMEEAAVLGSPDPTVNVQSRGSEVLSDPSPGQTRPSGGSSTRTSELPVETPSLSTSTDDSTSGDAIIYQRTRSTLDFPNSVTQTSRTARPSESSPHALAPREAQNAAASERKPPVSEVTQKSGDPSPAKVSDSQTKNLEHRGGIRHEERVPQRPLSSSPPASGETDVNTTPAGAVAPSNQEVKITTYFLQSRSVFMRIVRDICAWGQWCISQCGSTDKERSRIDASVPSPLDSLLVLEDTSLVPSGDDHHGENQSSDAFSFSAEQDLYIQMELAFYNASCFLDRATKATAALQGISDERKQDDVGLGSCATQDLPVSDNSSESKDQPASAPGCVPGEWSSLFSPPTEKQFSRLVSILLSSPDISLSSMGHAVAEAWPNAPSSVQLVISLAKERSMNRFTEILTMFPVLERLSSLAGQSSRHWAILHVVMGTAALIILDEILTSKSTASLNFKKILACAYYTFSTIEKVLVEGRDVVPGDLVVPRGKLLKYWTEDSDIRQRMDDNVSGMKALHHQLNANSLATFFFLIADTAEANLRACSRLTEHSMNGFTLLSEQILYRRELGHALGRRPALAESLVGILRGIKLTSILTDDTLWRLVDWAYRILNSFSSCSDLFAKVLAETAAVETMCQAMKCYKIRRHLGLVYLQRWMEVMRAAARILYNMVRAPHSWSDSQTQHVVDVLQALLDAEDEMVSLTSILTLAHLLDQDKVRLLQDPRGVLRLAVRQLLQAQGTPYPSPEKLTCVQLMQSLAPLVASPSLRQQMVGGGVERALFQLIGDSQEASVREAAARLALAIAVTAP